MRLHPDVYFQRYGAYTFLRHVGERRDFLYNDTAFAILKYVEEHPGCGCEELCRSLSLEFEAAQEELEQDARPELASQAANMEDYDVILLGYPIWWHRAPMTIYTFLESYDLTGKTVIPFCTSGGSSISESMPALRRIAQEAGAEVGKGLTANSTGTRRLERWLDQNQVTY